MTSRVHRDTGHDHKLLRRYGASVEHSIRDRVLGLTAPVVLVALALISIHRFHDVQQSSWQGFGFGMFATYDNYSSRYVRIDIEVDATVTRVDASDRFRSLVERSRVAPGGDDPRELALRVRQVTDADRVTVEIWGIEVAPTVGGLAISVVPLRQVAVP